MDKKTTDRLYHAALYARLSREDGDKEESDSIANQKSLIRNWLSGRPDIELCMECADDGWSGADFDRPDFKRMVREIEAGNIDCVVVKDLSRFGRNFVDAGRYIDQIFPARGVRFIAINDGFDSINGRTSTDYMMVSFKNLINDAYCRDISIKVRSQLEVKRKNGDFIGSFAAYGYLKDPDDRHRLAVDEYAAAVVRDIFRWKLDGASQQRIADRLNERGELPPMEYKRSCGLRYQTGFRINPESKWTAVAVGRILRNELYTGTMVQGKRTTPNHKVKKTVVRPQEEWARVENSHEPIISREDFLAVGRLMMQDTRVAPKEDAVYLLSGLASCADCGQNMVRSSVCRNGKTYAYYMCCSSRTGRGCSSHRISVDALEKAVFLALKQHIAAVLDMERVLGYLETLPLRQEEVRRADAKLLKKQEEAGRYERLKRSLYESLADGLVSKEEYLELKAVYDEKLQEAQAGLAGLEKELEDLLHGRSANAEWVACFRQHKNITKLTRRIAVSLIERVEVHEGSRVTIHFRYQDSYERAAGLIESLGAVQAPEEAPMGKGGRCAMARTSRKTARMEAAGQPVQPGRTYQAAAYVRLSVEDNNRAGDADSIIMQQHILERYISMQPDMALQGVYVDNGETGTDFARPGFERMMDCVRERSVDCIVVKDLSRFGRNYVEAGYYLSKIFPYLGVRFVAVNDGYDTAGDGGGDELVLSLKNLVNDLYAKDISQKVSSSLLTKQKKGEFIGAFPPYGYLKSPEDKHKLIPDPETAPVVRDIFQWRIEGQGIALVARRLIEMEVPCPAMYHYLKGHKKKKPSGAGAIWQAQGIKALTRNPVYAGHMAQGKHKKSLSSGIPMSAVPCGEWIVVEHTHEAVVSQEAFDRVQEITRQRHDECCARNGKYASTENIFKGLLVCADCGTKMVRYKDVSRAGKARYTFICPVYSQNLGGQGCTLKSIGEPELKEAVLHALRLEIDAALDLEGLLAGLQAQEGFREKCRGLDAGIRELEQKIKRKATLRGSLFESYSDGLLTEQEYQSMKEGYDKESGKLKEELEALEKERHRCTSTLAPQNRWITALKGYRAGEAVTRQMAGELIQKIYVRKRNEITIVWNFQDEFARLDAEARQERARK